MDPYFTGVLVGILLGAVGGMLALALVSHDRSTQLEDDAARFRALRAHSSAVSDDEAGGQVSLTELADSIRSGRVRRELA